MAKTVKGATITFEVTDNGTLKMVGQNSRTAKKGLDNVGKSAGDVRRNMQAMSGRVESGTKGFARMQQGTGGLVQSYAILASTLFALGAAFRAMENAANIENQTKGFRALAQITGTSLLSITASVRAATGSMLDFQTAAQQTAIASAAGFTSDQIRFLAEGAKLASVTLGRDLTDSFNRLIRGVTKAEPELLDELGIILRLDIATRKFAAANGLVAEKLTIAERRMAVFEEVQRQLIGNFGAMRDEADNFLNPFSRLSVAISDLIKAMQGPVVEFFASFAEFLTQNIGALTTAFALLGLSILRQIVPSIGTLSASFTTMGNNAVIAANKADRRMKASARLVRMRSKTEVAAEINKSQIVRKEIIRRFGSEEAFNKKSMAGQLARIKFMIQMEKMGMSKTKQFNQQRLNSLMVVEKRIQEEIKRTGLISNAVLAKMKIQLHSLATGPVNALKVQFGKLAGVITVLGKAISFLGAAFNKLLMAAMAFFTVKFLIDMLPGVKKINNIVQELNGNLKASGIALKEMAFFADRTLLEDKLSNINQEFGLVEGTLKGANVELEFFNNMIKGIEGPNTENFRQFIQDESRKIIELFSDGGLVDLGSMIMGTVTAGHTQSDVNESFAGRRRYSGAESRGGNIASAALEDAVETQINSLLTNAIAAVNSGQLTDAQAILEILGENVGQQFIAGLTKATADGDEYGVAAANFATGFAEELAKNKTDELAMTFFTGLDEGFSITGLSNELINAIKVSMGFREEMTDITGVVVNFREEAKSLSETLVGMIPKPSNAEKTAAQLESMLRTIFEIDEETGERLSKRKEITLEMEDGRKITGSILQIARDHLGIEAETDEQVISILESERERLELVDKRLQTHKTLSTLVKMEIDRMAFVNTRVSKRMQTEFKIFDLQLKQVQALDKFGITQTDLIKLQGAAAENLSDAEKEILAGNAALEQQIDLLESSLDRIEMLGKALLETFDSSAATNLAKLFDTANLGEFGGKEFINALAVDLRKTVSKSMAEGLVDGATEMLTPEKFKMNKKLDPAQKILQVHKQHVDGLAGILDMHVQGIAQVMGHQGTVPSVTANFDPSDPNAATYGSLFGPSGDTKPGGFRDALQGHFGRGGTLLTGLFGKSGSQTGEMTDDGSGSGIEEMTVKASKGKAGILGTYGGTDIFGIKTAMDKTFGEGGTFEESGGKIFGEGGMFQSIGGSLFDTFFGEGGMGSSLLSLFGFAKGGYTAIQAASGGTFSGPTTGYPATLHGNEAVVPLPDGKNIPVDLGAKANNTNNTNITVNMADGSSTTDSDGAAQLAQAIDAAVQNTIEKELRPGGILAG